MGGELGDSSNVFACPDAVERVNGWSAGLKYEVLLGSGGLFDLYNVENRTDVLERLQVMEATALTELRKRSNGKSA